VRVHGSLVPKTIGHDMVGQVLGLGQLTSQAHALLQSMDAQACGEQLIEHGPGPQLMLWHAPPPWHSMSHCRAAAQSMSPQEREAMVRSMVDRLAARLEQNPNDEEGWSRLARAYDVLGEPEKAGTARARAARLGPAEAPSSAATSSGEMRP